METASSSSGKRKLIAIVEDDVRLTEFFRDLLKLKGRWDVRIIDDGQVARQQLPDCGADVIVLDVGLPGLDGVSLYKMLRGHLQTRHIPIVVVTGSHKWELERMGIQPDILLHKPFHLQEFIDVITALSPQEHTPE